MNYIKNNIKTYVNSFKNKRILLVLALNILFIIITVALIKLTSLISRPWVEKINKVDLSNIVSQSEGQLQNIIATLKGFALFALLTAILFILLLIISWSFCQGIIYNILLKKKFNFKYFEKFLLLNIIWFIPWLILIFIIISGAKIEYFITLTLIIILLFLHFSFILYILFTKNNKLSQIKKALNLGIVKIHNFIIPYLLIAITYVIITQLNLLNLNFIIITLVYLLFFSWLQNYTKDIILNISKT